jgi:amylosucrase
LEEQGKEDVWVMKTQLISDLFRDLYGTGAEAGKWHDQLLAEVNKGAEVRGSDLKDWDASKALQPDWFARSDMIGYSCYVDKFAENLAQLTEHVDYLAELGVSYLHLLPLLKSREGENDGGFAVSDFTEVEPALGTMTDLQRLCDELRSRDICLCIDLVVNHTADDHPWAQAAKQGDARYQDYYLSVPTQAEADMYEVNLVEVFPNSAPGNFTWNEELQRFVWTTFYPYQWDLNYRNPEVLVEVVKILIFLANAGIGAFRLDAAPFIWKESGTNCQSRPQVHTIIQLLRECLNSISPAILFKAESIVPTKELGDYLGAKSEHQECQLAYHNILMVSLWEALATGDISHLPSRMQDVGETPKGTTWLNYLRCHDEIVWGVLNDPELSTGVKPEQLHFLADFYAGNAPGSFALGKTFQVEPGQPGDKSTGMTAALAGLESAIRTGDEALVSLAIERYKLMYSVMFAFPGIPLFWMGDEVGLLNDYDYESDPSRSHDDRWLNRPTMDWGKLDFENPDNTIGKQIFEFSSRLVKARKGARALHADGIIDYIPHQHPALLCARRSFAGASLVLLANFAAEPLTLEPELLANAGLKGSTDLLSQQKIPMGKSVVLRPYQSLWLV